MSEVVARFAPSPTGFLHLGGARTALFNYLFARRSGGRFILRIEDTDRARSKDEYVAGILDALAWLGLDYDEGPVFQSKRSDVYRRAVARLGEAGAAYWCACSPAELEAKRAAAQAEGRKPMYDRACRDLGREPGPGDRFVLRFRAPLDGETRVEDLVRGPVVFDNREIDDLILLRGDGSPTFHLVVVADDAGMGVTHVLRGEDHLTNTPRQMQIFRALGVEPPRYGHLPLIIGRDRARLSKRHGATSVTAYRQNGYLPEALLNYLARLGWASGDRELFSKAELVELFDLGGLNRSAATFDPEKLTWVNFQHQKEKSASELATLVRPYLDSEHGDCEEAYLEAAVGLLRERAKTLVELADEMRVFLADRLQFDEAAVEKHLDADGLARLAEIHTELVVLSERSGWTEAAIEAAFRRLAERGGIKLGRLAQPVRVALTGGVQSPGIFELCAVLGPERTLERLRRVLDLAPEGRLPKREG